MRSVSDTVLTDWNEEVVAIERGSRKTCAEKNVGSPSKGPTEPISGTKDPTKTLKHDAQLQKMGAKALCIDSEVTKTGANSWGKSAPKEQPCGSQQSVPSGQLKFKQRGGCPPQRGFF